MGSKILMTDITVDIAAGDIPACKYAFDYAGCDFDANTITCPISGTVLGFTGLTDNGDGTFTTTAISPTRSSLLDAPGTTDMSLVLIAPVKSSDNDKFQYGNSSSGPGLSLKPGTEYVTMQGAADYHTLAAANMLGAADYCGILTAKFTDGATGSSKKDQYDSGRASTVISEITGANTLLGIAAGMSQTDLDAADNPDSLKFSNTGDKIAGAYVFFWEDGAPDDTAKAVGWMGVNHRLYPGWLGRS